MKNAETKYKTQTRIAIGQEQQKQYKNTKRASINQH